MHENFGNLNFFEKQKGFLTNLFGTVRQKNFNGEYSEFSETPKCCPYDFFGTVRQKIFDEKFAENTEISGGIDVCRKPLKNRF